MTLELNKLTHQVEALGVALAAYSAELDKALPIAQAALNALGPLVDNLEPKIHRAIELRWAGAIPTSEPVAATFPLPPHPPHANIIAADGSQVYPDRHGAALYYLLNIGSIVFRHGLAEAPQCHSEPQAFYDVESLYEGEQLIASSIVDAQRDVHELRELATLATAEASTAPALALLDNGLLLYLALGATNQRKVDDVLLAYLNELDALRTSGAAVAGIIDRPQAAQVIRMLRLAMLEQKEITPDALRNLGPFTRLTDEMLFSDLKHGERSALFVNASTNNLEKYQPRGHKVYFFNLNAGKPDREAILRVEVPEWVAQDQEALNLVHAGVMEQCRVTNGFPYVLMRAHELAVVTARERNDLGQMVARSMVRQGLAPSISHKAQGKLWTARH